MQTPELIALLVVAASFATQIAVLSAGTRVRSPWAHRTFFAAWIMSIVASVIAFLLGLGAPGGLL